MEVYVKVVDYKIIYNNSKYKYTMDYDICLSILSS